MIIFTIEELNICNMPESPWNGNLNALHHHVFMRCLAFKCLPRFKLSFSSVPSKYLQFR